MSIMQDLYDSEINFSVSTFWDGGFDVKLGDEMNGFLEEANLTYWGQVSPWLQLATLRHYPNSAFAQKWSDGAAGHGA